MTVGVVASCSPAEWGVPRDRLCCARTGAPHRGNPSPPPHTQGLQGRVEYWKAQCGESRMLRLGGGKVRKPLLIRTKWQEVIFRLIVFSHLHSGGRTPGEVNGSKPYLTTSR